MKASRELFRNLRTRTGMFVSSQTYDAVAAFVMGFEAATEGGALHGFQPWLALKRGGGFNLHWTGYVLLEAFPDGREPTTPAEHRRAIDTLFDLIDEFDAACPSYDDIVAVFAKLHPRIEIQQTQPKKKRRKRK
jgi:hypothetical protein